MEDLEVMRGKKTKPHRKAVAMRVGTAEPRLWEVLEAGIARI